MKKFIHNKYIFESFKTNRMKRIYVKEKDTGYVIGYLECSIEPFIWKRSQFVVYEQPTHELCKELSLRYYSKFFKEKE